MKTINTVGAAVAIALLGCDVLCEQAQAVAMPINGTIRFAGSATATGASPGSPVTIQFTNPWQVSLGLGVYSGVTHGTLATFTNFDFTGDGSSAVLSAPPIKPLWSFSFGGNNFSFDLETLLNGHVEAGAMSLSGTGIAHADGFDDTPAVWAVSGTGSNFAFRMTSATTAVPESGATMTLLAIGLGGIVMLRRRLGFA